MTTRMRLLAVLIAALLVSGACWAQEKNDANDRAAQAERTDAREYQMVFIVEEVENGKVYNARRYATNVALSDMKGERARGSIRTGERMPIATGTSSVPDTKVSGQTQFTYIDVGFNVDFDSARIVDGRVYLSITADLNSSDAPTSDSQQFHPTIKHNSWRGDVTVPPGKPAVIFSSDDVASKRTTQVALTVTPVK